MCQCQYTTMTLLAVNTNSSNWTIIGQVWQMSTNLKLLSHVLKINKTKMVWKNLTFLLFGYLILLENHKSMKWLVKKVQCHKNECLHISNPLTNINTNPNYANLTYWAYDINYQTHTAMGIMAHQLHCSHISCIDD